METREELKQDLTENLVDRLGLTHRDSKALVESFFDQIRATVAKGEEMNLSNFGNFTVRDKRLRHEHNQLQGATRRPASRSRSRQDG